MKKYLQAYTFLLPIASALIALDQWTKSIVRKNLAFNDSWMPWEWLRPYARIVHWRNTGAAFGFAQGWGTVFAALAVIVVLLILFYFPQIPKDDFYLKLALTLQFAGATGNLIDRLMLGHVTDFISIGRFPVFNVADSCITIGAGALLLGIWLEERKTPSPEAQIQNE